MDIYSSDHSSISKNQKLLFAASYSLFILTNIASMSGVFGPTNAEVSKRFGTPLTPAGWAFSIWGLIFILQLAGVISSFSNQSDPDGVKNRSINAIAKPWMLSWIAAIFWTFSFAYATPTSMWLCFFFISTSLVAILQGLLTLYKQHIIFGPLQQSLSNYILYSLPTSILTAWLSVASSIQLVIALSSQVHDPQSLEIIASIMAIVVVAGGLTALLMHKDTAYGLTLLWALVAVFENTPSVIVQRISLIGLIVVLIGCIASVLRRDQGGSSQSVGWETRQQYQPLVNGSSNNNRQSMDDMA